MEVFGILGIGPPASCINSRIGQGQRYDRQHPVGLITRTQIMNYVSAVIAIWYSNCSTMKSVYNKYGLSLRPMRDHYCKEQLVF